MLVSKAGRRNEPPGVPALPLLFLRSGHHHSSTLPPPGVHLKAMQMLPGTWEEQQDITVDKVFLFFAGLPGMI